MNGTLCAVGTGVNHLVWAYGNLAFLWGYLCHAGVAYVRNNGTSVAASGGKTATITNGSSAGAKGIPGAASSVEGVDVVSYDAVVAVAAYTERRTASTAEGVARVRAHHFRSPASTGIPEVEVDGAAGCSHACYGNKSADKLHIGSMMVRKSARM